MEEQQGPVKVFLRKSGLASGVKKIDLNSLRQILEKTQNKQQVASKLEKIVPDSAKDSAEPVCQYASPEKIVIKPDPDSTIETKTRKGIVERTTISIKKDPVRWMDSISPLKADIKKEVIDSGSGGESLRVVKRAQTKKISGEPADKKFKHQVQRQFDDKQVKPDYRCCFCSYKTGCTDDYRKHIATHIKNMRCNLCSFSADNIAAYNSHVKEAHGLKQIIRRMAYSCSMCSFRTMRFESLVKHKSITGHKDKGETPSYKCKLCDYADESVFKLAQHILSHSRRSVYCKKCCEPSSGDVTKHNPQCMEVLYPVAHENEFLEKIKPSMVFDCTLCEFQCEELLFLVEHIKAHAKYKFSGSGEADDNEENGSVDLPFCCTMCEYRCVRPSKLALHMKTHGPEAVFSCKNCDYESKDLALFKVHRKLHFDKNLYPCFVCLMKFPTREELKSHMSTHSTNKPFSCHMCDYKCLTKSRILLHLKTHPKKKTQIFFPCPLCANKYSTSVELRAHLKSHNHEGKPYQCDFCDYSCFTSELLRIHVQKHSGNQRFRCEICQNHFPSEVKLKLHIRDHLQIDKPLKCDVCNTSFTSRTELNRHIPIHAGKNPFICFTCSADFPSSAARRTHMAEVHKEPAATPNNDESDEECESSKNDVSVADKYGYVEEDIYEDSDSDGEDVHEGQHQLIGYPEIKSE